MYSTRSDPVNKKASRAVHSVPHRGREILGSFMNWIGRSYCAVSQMTP
jgi:hypothetical protein